MRFLAVLLLFCICFLSVFPQPEKDAIAVSKGDCCKKDMKRACGHESGKQQDNSCNTPYCTAIFSCSLCGFIVQQPLSIGRVFAKLLSKPVSRYNTGSPTSYHEDDWKPPKVC